MSINIKKYTKDQMAKMVEEAQEEAQTATAYEKQWREQIDKMGTRERELRAKIAALTEQISQMNGEAINRANEIANLKADADALEADLDASKNSAKYLNDQGQEYWRAWQASKREATDLRNALADTKEAKERMNATLADCRATLAREVEKRKDWEQRSCWQFNHPWRNLWAWVKRKLGCKA